MRWSSSRRRPRRTTRRRRQRAHEASIPTKSCSLRSFRRRAMRRSRPATRTRSASIRTRTKTQVRQAVEELFNVKVLRGERLHGAVEAQAPRSLSRAQAGLEEGDRAAQAPATRSRSSKGSTPDARPSLQADLTRPPLHDRLDVRGGSRSRSPRKGADREADEEGRPQQQRPDHDAPIRAGVTSAVTASSTSSAAKTGYPPRSLQSNTTRTAPRGSRCSTTPTARRATSSLRRDCGVGALVESGPAADIKPGKRPSARETSPRARSCTNVELKPRPRRPDGAERRLRRPARRQGRGLRSPPAPLGRDAPGAAHLSRATIGQVGKRGSREHHRRQGRTEPVEGQAPDGARLGDEPGRPPARRGRGASPRGGRHPVTPWGVPNARQAHAPQAQGIRPFDRPQPQARKGETQVMSRSSKKRAFRRSAADGAASRR